MKKLFIYGCLSLFVVLFVLLPVAIVYNPYAVPYILLYMFLSGFWVFRDTLNCVQVVGPVYWITRDNVPKNTPIIGLGFMRETQAPWRVGNGIQISVLSRSFQIGICRKRHYKNEVEGELAVLGGRFMEASPEEIGTW